MASEAPSKSIFSFTEITKTKGFWPVVGASVAVVGIIAYLSWPKSARNRDSQPLQKWESPSQTAERAKEFIKKEMLRLKDPQLVDDGAGILRKKDFFDLLMVIQLKTKLKLHKLVGRNQRERVKFLEKALNPQDQERENLQLYIEKALEIMNDEFQQYEDQFEKILEFIGITSESWNESKELYIQGAETSLTGEDFGGEGFSIEQIDKRVYEYLPHPNLPKSLTRDKTKSTMLDVNHRASWLFKNHMRDCLTEFMPPEYQPLLMETIAFDLAFLEYSLNESVFRYAIHKYELSKDQEIRECLEDYLSS